MDLLFYLRLLFLYLTKNIGIYEIHNSGALYNLGFIIGASAFFSGSGRASTKNKK